MPPWPASPCPPALSTPRTRGRMSAWLGRLRSALQYPVLGTTASGQCFLTLAAPEDLAEPPEDFVKIPIPRLQPQGVKVGSQRVAPERETAVGRPGLPLTRLSPCAQGQCFGVPELSVTTGGEPGALQTVSVRRPLSRSRRLRGPHSPLLRSPLCSSVCFNLFNT